MLRNISINNLGVVRSSVKDLDEEFFAGVEHSLVTLSLQHCKLTYVPRGINKITSLKSLDLQGNNISELYPYSFYGASIAHLNLAHNILITLSENAFLGLEGNLKSLNLKGNMFKSFPMSAVRNLQNLEDLNLGMYCKNYILCFINQNKIHQRKNNSFLMFPVTERIVTLRALHSTNK